MRHDRGLELIISSFLRKKKVIESCQRWLCAYEIYYSGMRMYSPYHLENGMSRTQFVFLLFFSFRLQCLGRRKLKTNIKPMSAQLFTVTAAAAQTSHAHAQTTEYKQTKTWIKKRNRHTVLLPLAKAEIFSWRSIFLCVAVRAIISYIFSFRFEFLFFSFATSYSMCVCVLRWALSSRSHLLASWDQYS